MKTPDQDSQCYRKKPYRKKEALGRAAVASKRTGEVIWAYKCSVCKEWHIGHPNLMTRVQRVKKRIAQRLKQGSKNK